MAGKHVEAKLDSLALNVENVNKALQEAREAALEEQDKESRKNNIIVYRAQESTATSTEDRLREDVRFCQNLHIGLNAGLIDEDIKKVQRLGRRVDAQTNAAVCKQGSKKLVMESLCKLKSMEAKYRNVGIAHDMTKKEREECKTLVNEAKVKNESETGDWIYRVRGPPGQMKIVSFRRQ